MEGNRIPKRVLYMNLGTRRWRGRPRNRWQDEVREGGIVGGEGWQEKVHNRQEWKKLLRTGKESSCSAHVNGMNAYLHLQGLRRARKTPCQKEKSYSSKRASRHRHLKS